MIVGYGAVFNRDSADMGFIEQVDPSAFTKTLQEADVRGLGNHDANWLLGRTKAGTMRLRSDANGLYYEIDVNPQDPDGQRALAKVQRGDWDGSSFSFQTVRDEWNWQTQPPQRRLLEVSLIDVGPVTFPAYPDATAASRALEPIAEKVGRPVGELVTALKTGEIRSIMGGTTMDGEESRAVWTTAYVNDLPDSAFLYIESGGEKDGEGKTKPRSLRHFPYKDANGNVDLPHLRNALARIPQSNLPQSVKDSVQAKAEKILAANTDAKNSLDTDTESRAGKMISKANLDAMQAVHDSLMGAAKGLRDLMDTAMGGEPADSDVEDSLEDPDEPQERDLEDVAQSDSPLDSDVGDAAVASPKKNPADEPGRGLTLVAAQVEMRRRIAELEAA